MTIIEAIDSAERALAGAGIESARLDAEVLAAHVIGSDRASLYLRRSEAMGASAQRELDSAIARRAKGCPVAYITGVKEFWSIPIRVTEDVLVPRPDTEALVEEALRFARDAGGAIRILDLCTGSGCVAAALASELPQASIVAADVSDAACAVARENLAFAGERASVVRGDLFGAVGADEEFDLIVANPPYIRAGEIPALPRDIADFEPPLALAAGESGLDFICRIIEDGPRFLRPGGWLMMEIGQGQAGDCTSIAIASESYDTIRTAKDLAGIERVAMFRKSPFGN